MKMHTLALALAALLPLAAAPASAQGNVTLFGIVDLAARYVDNTGRDSVKSMISGGNATSRFGLRGQEDLGDGLYAGFHLESGILADTGASVIQTQLFDRRSTVSVGHRKYGELRAGRDYVPTYQNWNRYDPFSYVGVAGANHLISPVQQGPIRAAFGANPNTLVRSSNAVELLLPGGLGGLEGGLMVAAGEGGEVANGLAKVLGGRLGYTLGKFSVSAARTTSQSSQTGNDRFEDTAVGGTWNGGFMQVSLAWREFGFQTSRQTDWLASAWVPVGVGEIKFSWHEAKLSGSVGRTLIDGNGARQLGLGYVYNLSKRSALYGTAARIENKGAATYAVPGGAAPPTAGGNSTGFDLGVRHSF